MARKRQKPKRSEDPNAMVDVSGSHRRQRSEERDRMAVESSELFLQEAGLRGGDPDYRAMQIYVMTTRLGIPRTRAAQLVGLDRAQGARVFQKLRTNARFKTKCEELTARMVEAYKSLTAARLPEISELDAMILQEYRKNPEKLIDKPTALKNLRGVLGIGGGDGVQIHNEVTVDISTLERLQGMVQADVDVIDVKPGK